MRVYQFRHVGTAEDLIASDIDSHRYRLRVALADVAIARDADYIGKHFKVNPGERREAYRQS